MNISNHKIQYIQVLALILILISGFANFFVKGSTENRSNNIDPAKIYYLKPIFGSENLLLTVEIQKAANGLEYHTLTLSPLSGTDKGRELQQWRFLNDKLFNPITLKYIGTRPDKGIQAGNEISLTLTTNERMGYKWIPKIKGNLEFRFKAQSNPKLVFAVDHAQRLFYASSSQDLNRARSWRIIAINA